MGKYICNIYLLLVDIVYYIIKKNINLIFMVNNIYF